jgi:ArsR family transcriptional regulator
VVSLLKALGAVGERNHAEVRQIMDDYFYARDALAPISREELLSRLRDDMVTLIDVRPEHEFNLGHLPGALNVPLDALEKQLKKLPKNQEIVAYCRGPYCIMSFEAVAALRARGYRVRRLEDGFPEWMAAGLDVEVETPAAATGRELSRTSASRMRSSRMARDRWRTVRRKAT